MHRFYGKHQTQTFSFIQNQGSVRAHTGERYDILDLFEIQYTPDTSPELEGTSAGLTSVSVRRFLRETLPETEGSTHRTTLPGDWEAENRARLAEKKI